MRITKITWKIDVSRTHTPNLSDFDLIFNSTKWPYILSKVRKRDNIESDNFLTLRFINIWGLRSNLVGCQSFHESNSLDFLAVWD